MRMLPAGAAIMALALLASACTSRSHLSKPTARDLCRRALPGRDLSSAQLTTVGAICQQRIGPGTQPARHAFGSATAATTAAWCWTNDGNATWTAYAAGPHNAKLSFASITGPGGTPSGAPLIP